MNSTALTLMVVTMTAVTAVTIYFFWLVLKTPPRQEPDSYADNDDELR
jgi:flagellar basal body-associated protein FliL